MQEATSAFFRRVAASPASLRAGALLALGGVVAFSAMQIALPLLGLPPAATLLSHALLLLPALAAWRVMRATGRPLRQLAQALAALGRGETDHAMPAPTGVRELDAVIRAAEGCRDQLRLARAASDERGSFRQAIPHRSARAIGQPAGRIGQDNAAAIAAITGTAKELSRLVDEIEGTAARHHIQKQVVRVVRDAESGRREATRHGIGLPVRIDQAAGTA